MSEHAETPERRHARYLRYAAEARELAARTTDSARDHHVRVALSCETMSRKLAPLFPSRKPNLLQSVGGTVHGGSDASNRPRPVLGHRTEAHRSRLADRVTRASARAHLAAQDCQALPKSTEDPSR